MSNPTEAEIERFVLTQTKTLSDGSKQRIFTQKQRLNEGNKTGNIYDCHLCSNANMSETVLQTHIRGKKHQRKLMVDYVSDAEQFRAPLMPKAKQTQHKKAILGWEYVVKLIGIMLNGPFYTCSLCHQSCEARNILSHVASNNHTLKYLKLHFRNVYNELQQHRRFNDVIAFQEEVLSRISETIEKKFGRKKPFTCEYNKCKMEIRDQLTLNDHITQEEWPENLEVLLENLEINEDVESDEGPAHSSTSSRASEPSYSLDDSKTTRKRRNTGRTCSSGIKRPRAESSVISQDEAPVNLISICRFLLALESELGLLATKVLDLLTEAVEAKMKSNSADDLLFRENNYITLAVVQQKLLGVLDVAVLNANKVIPVQHAIHQIVTLLEDVAGKIRKDVAKLIKQNLMQQGLDNVGADVIEEIIKSFMAVNKAGLSEAKEVEKSETSRLDPQPSTSRTAHVEKNNKKQSLSIEDLQLLLRDFVHLTESDKLHLDEYLLQFYRKVQRKLQI